MVHIATNLTMRWSHFVTSHTGLLIELLSHLGLSHNCEKSSKAVQVSLQQQPSVGN